MFSCLTVGGFGRAYLAVPSVAAAHPRVAAAHPRAAAAHHRAAAFLGRRGVVHIVVAETLDYYLTGHAFLGDGGGCADHCGYRRPCSNRRQE